MIKPGSQSPATTAETCLPGLGALREHAPGTALVRSIVVRAHETVLRLGYPNGREIVVALPEVPRRGDEDPRLQRLVRPLAVLIRNGRTRVDCSVLGTSKQGPSRIAIGVEQALTLCESGIHTVLRSES